jgi:hypothetical protein
LEANNAKKTAPDFLPKRRILSGRAKTHHCQHLNISVSFRLLESDRPSLVFMTRIQTPAFSTQPVKTLKIIGVRNPIQCICKQMLDFRIPSVAATQFRHRSIGVNRLMISVMLFSTLRESYAVSILDHNHSNLIANILSAFNFGGRTSPRAIESKNHYGRQTDPIGQLMRGVSSLGGDHFARLG